MNVLAAVQTSAASPRYIHTHKNIPPKQNDKLKKFNTHKHCPASSNNSRLSNNPLHENRDQCREFGEPDHERILQNASFPPIFATHSHLYINAQIHFKTSSANHNHEEKRGGSWGEYLVLDAIVAKVHKPISSGWRSQAPVVEWLPLNSYRSSIASWRYVKVASSILAGGTTFCELNHCRIIF